MRYVIGVTAWNNERPDDVTTGILGKGFMNFDVILTLDNQERMLKEVVWKAWFAVFQRIDDAKQYVHHLSRQYRQTQPHNTYRFFLLKLDTKEFPYQVDSEKIVHETTFANGYTAYIPHYRLKIK